jgi:hypothetical protein
MSSGRSAHPTARRVRRWAWSIGTGVRLVVGPASAAHAAGAVVDPGPGRDARTLRLRSLERGWLGALRPRSRGPFSDRRRARYGSERGGFRRGAGVVAGGRDRWASHERLRWSCRVERGGGSGPTRVDALARGASRSAPGCRTGGSVRCRSRSGRARASRCGVLALPGRGGEHRSRRWVRRLSDCPPARA